MAACSERIRAAKGNPVTANELLVLLGRAWSRLLIYPGGLAAFGLIWLVGACLYRRTEPRTKNQVEQTIDNRRWTLAQRLSSIVYRQKPARVGGLMHVALHSIVPPWLALALLPLPLAVSLSRQIDVVAALALLEWPNLLAIQQDLRSGDPRRLAAALNSYPLLILATLALAQAGNSLELAALARVPAGPRIGHAGALHWLGAVAFALALVPALGIGPFANERRTTEDGGRRTEDGARMTNDDRRLSPIPHLPSPTSHPPLLRIGLRLRALGLVMLVALPWAGSEGDALALVRLLGAAALIGALLWGFDRLTREQMARRWAWAYLGLDAVLLLALLVAAYMALQSRLA